MNTALDIASRPLVLSLLAANILYFLWSGFVASDPDGVVPWRRPGAADARVAIVSPGVATVVLAGEAAVARESEGADEIAAAQNAANGAMPATCFAIGPFNSQAASAAAAAFLRARNYLPEIFYPAAVAPEHTAVLIDDLPTRADQQRVVRRLLDAGWRDVAALEPRKPAAEELTAVYPISLGVFKAASGAEERAAAARRLGLAPVLVVRHTIDAEHWLRVRSTTAAMSPADARRLAGGRGWRVTDCETK